MSSRCRECAKWLTASVLILIAGELAARDLVVCADPDSLPYSNERREGFENRIVELLAADLGDRVVYRWQPLRRGLIRKTLDARVCDVLVGVPVGVQGVATTSAYYRSSYVFVSRRSLGAAIVSFDDPRLRNATIGVQVLGADGAATPAALALADHGITARVVGFPLYGAQPAGQRMIAAIDDERLDVAIAWGPEIGYFAARARTPLVVGRPSEQASMSFAIAIALRAEDATLCDRLDGALIRARPRIDAVLSAYDVPIVTAESSVEPAP